MTEIDILHARKSADRFHKTTLLLASRVTDVPYADLLRGHFVTLPVIVSDGQTSAIYFPGKRGGDSDFITPYVVNAAFSLEIHLKVLRYLETSSWPEGHKLKQLYLKLSKASKDFLADGIAAIVANSRVHQDIETAVKKQMNILFSWDVERLVEQSSNAFVKWRYAFESNAGWFAGYKEVRDGLVARIKQFENSEFS